MTEGEEQEPLQPLEHRYPWYIGVFSFLFSCGAFGLPIYLMSSVLAGSFGIPAYVLILLFLTALGVGGQLLFVANYFPTILSDEEGVQVKFLWRYYRVPWQDVVDLEPMRPFRRSKFLWIVITRSLTPFHRFYGLTYAWTFRPGFTFTHDIGDYDRLLWRIKLHLRRNIQLE
jgi:hypothetical protein